MTSSLLRLTEIEKGRYGDASGCIATRPVVAGADRASATPLVGLAPKSTADCGHVYTERFENPASATLRVSERRQQKRVHVERALPSCDRPLRRLAKHAKQTWLGSAEG